MPAPKQEMLIHSYKLQMSWIFPGYLLPFSVASFWQRCEGQFHSLAPQHWHQLLAPTWPEGKTTQPPWLHLIISVEDLQSKIPKLPKLPIISCPKQCVKTPGSTIGSIVTPLRRTFQGSKTAGTSLIKVWFYGSMFRCKRNAKEFFWTWT